MKTTSFIAMTVLALVPLAACSNGAPMVEEAEQSYEVREAITTLAINAQNAVVTIETGDGAVTVREISRSTDQKPVTSHRVDNGTLLLTEGGCGGSADLRCDIEYQIRVPRTTATEIRTGAGAVNLRGLDGRLSVTTRAGAVKGDGLTSKDVTISTEAGATFLQFLEAPTSIRSDSEAGAVEVRVPGDRAYAVDVFAKTGGSDVSVRRDSDAAHRIRVRTQVGVVKVAPTV